MAAKYYLVLLFFLVLTTGFSQNPLDKRLSIKVENETTGVVLEKIQILGGFYFSYNSKLIDVNKLVTYTAYNEQVIDLLNGIFGKKYEYKHRGSYIIIQEAKPVLVKKKEVVFKGKVSSSVDSSQLQNVTIYEIDELKSTSTDENGDFDLVISTEKVESKVLIVKENYYDTIISSADLADTNLKIFLRPLIDSIKSKFTYKLDSTFWTKTFDTKKVKDVMDNVSLTEFKDFQLSLLPYIGTNGKFSGKITNKFSLNLLGGYAYGLNGLEIGGIFNILKDTMRGAQIAGVGNVVGGKTTGAQFAGVFNVNYGDVIGAQFGGVFNTTAQTLKGVQAAGVFNTANNIEDGTQIGGVFNRTKDIKNGVQIGGVFNKSQSIENGTQIGGVFNKAKDIKNGVQIGGVFNKSQSIDNGTQIGGVFNKAKNIYNGLQVSGVFNTSKNLTYGLQISGIYNISKDIKIGGQIGGLFNFSKNIEDGFQVSSLLNCAKSVTGFQIGLINLSDSISRGIPIGFLSFVKSGFHKTELSYQDYLSAGISFRTGVHAFYNIFAFNYYYQDNNPLASFGYGIGTQFNINERFFTNLELSSHSLFVANDLQSAFNELNVLTKLNLNLGFNVGKHLSLVAGPELNILISDNSSSISKLDNFSKRNSIYRVSNNQTELNMTLGYRVALRF